MTTLKEICLFLLLCSVCSCKGYWWIRGAGNFATVGHGFFFKCHVPDGVPGVVWKRDGIILGTVMTHSCEAAMNSNECCYSFHCGSPNEIKINIPIMSNNYYNQAWECYDIRGESYGNTSFVPELKAAVEYVTIHEQQINQVGHSITYTCVTGASRPPADLWFHYDNQMVSGTTTTTEVAHDLFVTYGSITVPITGDANRTIFCTTQNIIQEGRKQSNVLHI